MFRTISILKLLYIKWMKVTKFSFNKTIARRQEKAFLNSEQPIHIQAKKLSANIKQYTITVTNTWNFLMQPKH